MTPLLTGTRAQNHSSIEINARALSPFCNANHSCRLIIDLRNKTQAKSWGLTDNFQTIPEKSVGKRRIPLLPWQLFIVALITHINYLIDIKVKT